MSSQRGRPEGNRGRSTRPGNRPSVSGGRRGRTAVRPDTAVDNLVSSFESLSFTQSSDSWPSLGTSSINRRDGLTPRCHPPPLRVSENELDGYIKLTVVKITPHQYELDAKRAMCADLEEIVRKVQSNARLNIMGGLANNFALKGSDVDLCITQPGGSFDRWKASRLAEEFRKAGHGTELLLHTYIPLIKLSVYPRGGWPGPIHVDISWSNSIGIEKTNILFSYSAADYRVKPFVLFIKFWSKRNGLTDTRHGGMGSFAWCLLCIYFLMTIVRPPVVPTLQNIRHLSNTEVLRHGVNNVIGRWGSNTASLGSLMTEFFEFANNFDFETQVISLRGPLSKSFKGWNTGLTRGHGSSGQSVKHSYWIAVEDPLESNVNAARTLSYAIYMKIKAEFRRARDVFNGRGELSSLLTLTNPTFGVSLVCFRAVLAYKWDDQVNDQARSLVVQFELKSIVEEYDFYATKLAFSVVTLRHQIADSVDRDPTEIDRGGQEDPKIRSVTTLVALKVLKERRTTTSSDATY